MQVLTVSFYADQYLMEFPSLQGKGMHQMYSISYFVKVKMVLESIGNKTSHKLENIYSKNEMLTDPVTIIIIVSVDFGHSQYDIQYHRLT